MSQEIKHYVKTEDYVDFLINKNNQYDDTIKGLPDKADLLPDQREQLDVFERQHQLIKLEYTRSQYFVAIGIETMEIPDSTAYAFFGYRLAKIKSGINIQ